MIRRSITWFALGALAGIAASMWYGPSLMTWWWTPSAGVQTVWSESSVNALLRHFVGFQLVVGGVLGALLATVANLLAYRRRAAAAEVLAAR